MARRESHTLKSSLNLLLPPWHVPPAAEGSREEEKEVTGIEGSKGWQGGRSTEMDCRGNHYRGGEAKLITTSCCTHLFGHEQLGKPQLLLKDLP